MQIEIADINSIKPYENNPRKLSDTAIEKVAMSLKEYGFRQPIVVDKDRVIVAGHTRYRASKKLGLNQVPISIIDNLSEEQINAYRIADNRTAEESEWDSELLKMEIKVLEAKDFKLNLLGFNEDQLNDILFEEKQGLTDEDEVPETPEEPTSKLGDIWKLGNHRLMCGDSTDFEHTNKLLQDKIDLVFTDPPYGIDVVKNNSVGGGKIAKTNNYNEIIGDKTTETAKKFYELCININLKNFILWGGNYFTDFLLPSRCWIIWDKEMTGNFSEAEMGWTSFNKGGVKVFKHLWNGLSRKGNRKDELKSRVHPTQKPVGLFCEIFRKFTDFKTIYDGFLGSGSTLIACEKMDRICYGMELDPKYCDVIIKRWENFTGKKAELKNGQN